ncbi:MAG: hypothetical protein KAR07_08285 [Spirochaetes bacterium]|nr:hypothetical protein [Spirochaetota bacterium]
MKKLICTSLAVLFLITSAFLLAERRPKRPKYDKKTEITFTGKVVTVTKRVRKRSKFAFYHLKVKTFQQTYSVHLGPVRFFKKKNFTFAVGDNVEITGSKIQRRNRTIILAAKITKGEISIKLRDKNGRFLWGRRGRKNK